MKQSKSPKQKLIALLLVVLIAFVMLPSFAFAGEEENHAPVVVEGSPTTYTAYYSNPRSFDLSSIFSDSDEGDTLTYAVKSGTSSYAELEGSVYTQTWYYGPVNLTFKATDKAGASAEHSVTVNIENITATYPNVTQIIQQSTEYYKKGDDIPAMVTIAESKDGGTISYQWYVRDLTKVASNASFTKIPESEGGTNSSYKPSSDTVGVFQYYVVIYNSLNDEGNYRTSSSSAKTFYVTETSHLVKVAPAGTTIKLYDGETPVSLKDIPAGENSYHYYGADLTAGKTYKYEGFDADGKSIGTGSLSINDTDMEYTLRQAKFTVGTLATAQYSLTVKDGVGNQMGLKTMKDGELEKYTALIPILKGENNALLNPTYECELTTAAIESGNALSDKSTGVIGFNHIELSTINSVSLGVIKSTSITVPKEATLFVGYKTSHYMPFPEMKPIMTKTSGDNKNITYYYGLNAKSIYNLRVTMDGKITYADKFTATADGTQNFVITKDDLVDKGTEITDTLVARIYLNINEANHIQLENVGDTFNVLPFRVYQIVDTLTNNYFMEPDFHYNIISGKDVISIDDDGTITALKKGDAIVMVTYDPLQTYKVNKSGNNLATEKYLYKALDADNVGVFAVTVGENGEVKTNIEFDADFETVYYAAEINGKATNYNSAEFTFKPQDNVTKVSVMHFEVNEANDKVDYSGGFVTKDVKKHDDGSYTITLHRGRNLLKVETSEGIAYQVLRADGGIKVTYENKTTGEDTFSPGDKVSVSVVGAESPVLKMSGIYNPQSSTVTYTSPEGTTLQNTATAFEFVIPSSTTTDTYVLSGGELYEWWFGSGSGAHRDIDPKVGVKPNLNAKEPNGYYSVLPDVEIKLDQPEVRHKLTFVIPDGVQLVLKDTGDFVLTPTSSNSYTLPAGKYTYTVSGDGYETITETITFENTEDVEMGIALKLAQPKGEAWDGTTSEPSLEDGIYQITNAKELAWFAAKVNEGSLDIKGILKNDIYLSTEKDWTPIGNNSKKFAGTFDGDEHTVYDMTINGFQYKGLFGYVDKTGVVKDVTVTGTITNETQVYNQAAYHAGIAGYNGGTVSGCVSEVNITGQVYGMMGVGATNAAVGGVVGYNNGTVENSVNRGTINFTGQYVGGIVGINSSSIKSCVNEGSVSGKMYVGGITGGYSSYSGNNAFLVEDCANLGVVSATGSYAGGIVGYSGSRGTNDIKRCYNAADVTAGYYAGGILAMANRKTAISDCYNSGTISASGAAYVGGICGSNTQKDSTFTNCYNIGKSAGNAIVGTTNEERVTATNCYYLDTMKDAFTKGTAAKTSSQLKALAETLGENFAEDNFNINSGYPVLVWQPHGSITSPEVIKDLDSTQASYVVDETADYLIVEATGDNLSYQWYMKKPGSETFERIPYEVSNFYRPDTSIDMYGETLYYVSVTSTIGTSSALVNSAQTPIKVTLNESDALALSEFEKAVKDYAETINTDEQMIGLFHLEALYESLSDNAKKVVDSTVMAKYNDLFTQATKLNHKSGDFELVDAPWYIKLYVTAIEEKNVSKAMTEAIGDGVIIKIADVKVGIYTPDGYFDADDENVANIIADEAPFTFKLNVDRLSAYGDISVLHENKDGVVEKVNNFTLDKDAVSITTDGFSPFAILGTKSPKTGDSSVVLACGALLIASIATLVGVTTYRKKKSM